MYIYLLQSPGAGMDVTELLQSFESFGALRGSAGPSVVDPIFAGTWRWCEEGLE